MSATLPEILDRIDRQADYNHKLIKDLTALTRAQMGALGDDDEWTRFPKGNLRCPVSGLGRGMLYKLIAAKEIRRKTIKGVPYYAASDWRKLGESKP